MKKSLLMAVVLVLLMSLMFVGTAFAHPDPDLKGTDNAPTNPNGVLIDVDPDPKGVDIADLNADKVPVCGAHGD